MHVDGSAPSPCVPSLNGITGVAVAPHAESNRENKGQENERNDKTHTEHDGCEHEDTLSFSIQRKESGSCSTFFFFPPIVNFLFSSFGQEVEGDVMDHVHPDYLIYP